MSFGVVLAVVAGCTGDDSKTTTDSGAPTTTPTVLSIVGSYEDEFGTEHVITEEVWTQTYPGAAPLTFEIDTFGADWLVAQNGPDNAYSPDLWSRFDWVEVDGDLYYCQTAYDAPDAASAEAATPADTTDVDAGCGGFPFSMLLPVGA
jgi:hypothetical protein